METRAITRAVEKNGNEGKTMFDLTITHEVNELLKQVRKELRNKGFTINNINFYDNIKDLKNSYKELTRKIRGEKSYN